jgi:hypothetical protein
MTNEEKDYHLFGDVNNYTTYQRVFQGLSLDRISNEICKKIPPQKDLNDGMKKNVIILSGDYAGTMTSCRYDVLIKIVK